jgi:putative sterol carrier protein
MADIDEVRAGVAEVVHLVDDLEEETRAKIPDRSISAVITDLDIAFAGRFDSGRLVGVTEVDPDDAHRSAFRLHLSSDDLLALLEGELEFTHAWAKGRVRVDAGLRDLFALRGFL